MNDLDKINTIGVWLGSDTKQARSAVDFMNGLLDEIQELKSELEKVERETLAKFVGFIQGNEDTASWVDEDDIEQFLNKKLSR